MPSLGQSSTRRLLQVHRGREVRPFHRLATQVPQALQAFVLPLASARGPTPRALRNPQLTEAVTTTFSKEKERAARDQLTLVPNAAGTRVSAPTVWAIMRANGLRTVCAKAWKATIVQGPAARTVHIENHILDGGGKRGFTADAPGTRLVGDITFLSDQ